MFNFNKVPRPEIMHYWDLKFQGIEEKIDSLNAYNILMEEYLSKLISEASIQGKLEEGKNNQDEVNILSTTILSNTFYSSFLVQIISLIEHELRGICLLIENYNYQKFSINDLKGHSDIDKAKTYLLKTIELKTNLLNPEWQTVKNCYLLRNSIVHNQGYFDNNSTIHKLVEKCDSLLIGDTIQMMRPKKRIYSFTIKDGSINESLIQASRVLFQKIFDYIKKINTYQEK
ncbi:MAG: hypothetical protein K0B10_04540 [Vicingaceae bacterium]|nr:hypothetical protein [Vicingaceae bacterium]